MAYRDEILAIPGTSIDSNGRIMYKGQQIGNSMGGYQLDLIKKNAARIDENEAAAASKQQGVNLANQQQDIATQFRSNLPTYTGLLQDQSKKTIQRDLAENIAGLKQRSSSAGFLKGSGTQRQQAESIAGAQTKTLQSDLDIADAMEAQAKTFENQALATKMSLQGSANQAVIDQLRQNILDTQRQTELWKALGGALGAGVGVYTANANKG